MSERLNVGPCPYDENCAQVGSENYAKIARFECRLYAKQLEESITFKWPDIGCRVSFRITSNPHDYGTYHELDVIYDPEDPIAVDQAFYAEAGEANWTDENKIALETFLNNLKSKT